jgi:hypothetical protein
MPPLAPGDPHATLNLVDNITSVVIDVEGAKLVGREEALVLAAAVLADEAVSAGAEHTIIRFDQADLSHDQACLDFVFHARFWLQFMTAAHLPRLEPTIQRRATDALDGQLESVGEGSI